MPLIRARLGDRGPVVEVTIWVGAERAAALIAEGRTVPAKRTILALVDTGADQSAIDENLLGELGTTPLRYVNVVSSATGSRNTTLPVHDVQMSFGSVPGPEAPRWRTLRPVGVSIAAQGVLALIGRDMLSTCLMIYDGPEGALLLSY